MTDRQLLWRVELPLAVPEIIAGLRIATVSTVAIATLAFLAGAGGLGEPLYAQHGLQDRTSSSSAVLAIGMARRAWTSLILLVGQRFADAVAAGEAGDDPLARRRVPRLVRRRVRLHPPSSAMRSPAAAYRSADRRTCWHFACTQLEVSAVALARRARDRAADRARPRAHRARASSSRSASATRAAPSPRSPSSFLLAAFIGIGLRNVAIALMILGLPPILTNTFVGDAPGRPRRRRGGARDGHDRARVVVLRVELPLAVPTIMSRRPHRRRSTSSRLRRSPRSSASPTSATCITGRNVYGDDGVLAGRDP